MSLIGHGHVVSSSSTSRRLTQNKTCFHFHFAKFELQNLTPKPILFTNLLSFALTVTLNSPLPCLAIPSPNFLSPILPSTTPFSQSKNLPTGLEDGKIRPCPSINPSCVSTNPKSSSFAFPWRIPDDNSAKNATKKLQEATLKTQKNAKIQAIEDTPDGQYLQAEVDGGFGRDVVEFLVKGDVVAYRTMATKVTCLSLHCSLRGL